MGVIKWGAIISLALIFFGFIGFNLLDIGIKNWQQQHYLSFLPKELKVENILYKKTNTCGIVTGGNESGLIIYELSGEISDKIEKHGLEFFKKISIDPDKDYDREWYYGADWQNTPIRHTKEWVFSSSVDYPNGPVDEEFPDRSPSFHNFLFMLPCGAALDKLSLGTVDGMITKSENFYVYKSGRIIVVSPELKRVVLAFSG